MGQMVQPLMFMMMMMIFLQTNAQPHSAHLIGSTEKHVWEVLLPSPPWFHQTTTKSCCMGFIKAARILSSIPQLEHGRSDYVEYVMETSHSLPEGKADAPTKGIHNSSISALRDKSSASSHFHFFSPFLWHTLPSGLSTAHHFYWLTRPIAQPSLSLCNSTITSKQLSMFRLN
jgi:hypothetical protein